MSEYFDEPAHEFRGSTWETPPRPLPEMLDHAHIVSRIVDTQAQFESIGRIRVMKKNENGEEEEEEEKYEDENCTRSVAHLEVLFDASVERICWFCEQLPGFQEIPVNDRGLLLRANLDVMLVFRLARKYDLTLDAVRVVPASDPYVRRELGLVFENPHALYDALRGLTLLRTHAAEYALMQALAFFTGCPGLEKPDLVDLWRNRYWNLLNHYMLLTRLDYGCDFLPALWTQLCSLKGNLKEHFTQRVKLS